MIGTEENLLIEEWAEFGKQLFRLDVIAGGLRTNYLFDGRSKEIFRFKPFVCDHLKQESEELRTISSLFYGWNIGDEPDTMMALGLGPLWLRASQGDDVQKLEPSKNSDSLPLEEYIIYDVNLKQQRNNEVPYNLRMYFRQKDRFVDAIEWITIPAENDKEEKKKKQFVVARLKLNKFDISPIAESVFELPVGYGCVRSFQFDHPLESHASLELLHQGGPNQAILEITLSKSLDNILHSWESQRFTARLLRGSIKAIGQAHSYFVALIQSRDPKTSKIKRTKRVWSAIEKSSQAVVYTIDQETSKCQVSHESTKDHIQFSLSSSKQKDSKSTKPFIISADLISSLFNDYENFHMLREGTDLSSDLDSDENPVGSGVSIKDAMFEKRISNFVINIDGSVIWSGPISIIKKISSLAIPTSSLNPAGVGAEFVTNYHTVVTILFYSQDLSELQYKVVADLTDKDEVDLNFMHKQLDISACFSDQQKSNLIIKYPFETPELGKKIVAIQDLVQEIFRLDLFESFPIQPIQVSGIETSFDKSYMYLKMTMLELPLTQMFELKRDMRLVKGKADASGLKATEPIEMVSPNVEKCASACEYYNCYRFSYDILEHICRISMSEDEVKIEKAAQNELYEAVELKLSSDIWGYGDYSGGRSHLRPLEMIEIFEDLYENKAEVEDLSDDEFIPLTIRIARVVIPGMHLDDPEYINLIPASIESDINSMNEFVREEKTLLDETGGTKTLIRAQDSFQLKVQYNIVLEEHFFKDNIQGTLLEDLSYEDCAQLCENTDCRSFSYCKYNRKCHVTTLHKLIDIQSASKYDAKCTVFSLDYLSKFDNYGLVEAPVVVRKKLLNSIMTAHDCAINCMEETSFVCQGFFYCDKEQHDGQRKCLMQDKHLEEFGMLSKSIHRPKFKASISGDSSIGTNKVEQANKGACLFYSRSYLAQFDGYFDKSFKIPPEIDSDENSEIVTNLGAESCAQRCIQKSCLAFSVCLNSESQSPGKSDSLTSSGSKQICQLTKSEFKKDFVFFQPRCATYVLSSKSQFSSSKKEGQTPIMSESEPDKETSLDNKQNDGELTVVDPKQEALLKDDLSYRMLHLFSNMDQSNLLDKSHWLSKLLSAIVGVFIGIGSVFAWRDKDRLQVVVLEFAESLNNRIRQQRR